MKKMWIVAAIACAALMVSCGGEKKKSESVEDKAKAAYEALLNAETEEESKALEEKYQAYYDKLSEADQQKWDEVIESLAIKDIVAKAQELQQAMDNAKAGDEANTALNNWYAFWDSLSPEDQKKVDEAIYGSKTKECVAQEKTPDSACFVETDNASGATTTTANTATNTYTDEEVVAKATELSNRMIAAIKADDMELGQKIMAEGDAYMATLSEEQFILFEETSNNIAKAAGMYEE